LTDAKTLHSIIKENKLEINRAALFLADLGYFKTDSFLLIDDQSHFFLSRFKFDVNIYDKQNNKPYIESILTSMDTLEDKEVTP
jgi:hypothetical protein